MLAENSRTKNLRCFSFFLDRARLAVLAPVRSFGGSFRIETLIAYSL